MATQDVDNKRANHRYLLTFAFGGEQKRPVRRLLFIVAVFVLCLIAWQLLAPSGEQVGRPARNPSSAPAFWVATVALTFFVGILAFFLGVRQRLQRAMFRALQAPDPTVLANTVTRTFTSALPDRDAFAAQAKALAFALYDRGAEARLQLRQVDWPSKAPFVQALGHFAEAWISLLCERNVGRARDLFLEAHTESLVNPRIPGAATAERTYKIALTVCDVLSQTPAQDAPAILEDAVANHVSPYTRLLAAMALAHLMDSSGNHERAESLRRYIADAAPHCEPLRLTLEDFATPREIQDDSADLSIHLPETAVDPSNRHSPATRAAIRFGIWVALLVFFLTIWQLLGAN